MRCNQCGTEYPDDEKSCPQCGAASSAAPTDTSQAVPAADDKNCVDTTKDLVWKYSLMDLLDEAIIAVVLTVVASLVYWFSCYEGLAKLSPLSKHLITALIFVAPVLYVLWQIFRYLKGILTLRYELKPQKFYYSHGLFVRKTDALTLFTIRSMRLRQSLYQRLLGLGDIYLFSPDITNRSMKISGIANIWKRFNILEAYRQANQNQRIRTEKQNSDDSQQAIYNWRYSGWDLIDETMEIIVVTILFLWGGNWLISVSPSFAEWVKQYSVDKWLALGAIPALLWIWLIYTYISRRYFVSYQLTPTTFIRNSGLIVLKKDIYVLYYLQDIQFHQNLWQRIIGIGNLTLYMYSSEDPDGDKSSATAETRKIQINGLKTSTNAFHLVDEYRQRELQKYTGGPV